MSKKLSVAVGAAIVAFVASFWPGQEDLAARVVDIAITYLFVQGGVDAVKSVMTGFVKKEEAK